MNNKLVLSSNNFNNKSMFKGHLIIYSLIFTVHFPGGSDGKESTCTAGDLGSNPGLERSPGEGHDSPLQYFCLENLHGQRSLVGYSQWGCKQLDMTE